MKMKKTYAAALAAAMVLTAGLSAQANMGYYDEGAVLGNVNVTPGEGIVMNKTVEDETGATETTEVFKVDPDGNVSGVDGTFTGDVSGHTIIGVNGMIGGVGMENGQVVAENGINAGINGDFSVDKEGNVSGVDGTFTGDLSGNTILGNGGLIGGVGMENGQVVANNGIYAAHGDFNVDDEGNVEGVNGTFTGDVSGANGTFTGTVSGNLGDFDAIHAGNSLVGGVGLENGHIIAEDGIYAGNNNQFHVDTEGNVSTEGSLTVNDGATVNGGLTTDTAHVTGSAAIDGALAVGQGANINGGLAVNGGASINGGLTVDGTDVMVSIADNADKIAQNTTAIANNSSRINALDRKVSDLGGEIDNVGAISSALAGLHPLDYDGTGSKFQLAAAMGSYDGTQAAAIGGFYHFNEDIMMSVGGATSFGGDNKSAFNVGLSFRVGQGSSGKRVSNDEVLAQLTAMNDKIAALEAENQQLSEKVAALEGGEGAEAAEAE